METVTMSVMQITKTHVEVPAHLSAALRADVAHRRVGRGEGRKGACEETVTEHILDDNESLTFKEEHTDKEFMQIMYNRLIDLHHVKSNVYYMCKLKDIIDKL